MKALCVIMRSTFVTEQVRSLSTQMRGGSIRYQAQNLRNVHIPAWDSLDEEDVYSLALLYDEEDVSKIDACVNRLVARVVDRQPSQVVEQYLDFG